MGMSFCVHGRTFQKFTPAKVQSTPFHEVRSGEWYVTFMTEFGLTEEPYRSIAKEQAARLAHDPEQAWFHLRVDTSHDIRHVLAGYGPERLGEFCLLSFRFGQIHHPGMAIVIFLSVLDLIFVHRCRGLMAVWEAYRRGRRARLLDLLPWEKCFAEPLAVHRANLGLTPPQSYPCPFAPDAYLRNNAASPVWSSWQIRERQPRIRGHLNTPK